MPEPVGTPATASLSLGELVSYLKRRGRLQQLAYEVLTTKRVLKAAHAAGLTVSDHELQQAANRFRHARGLFDVEPTQQWLAEQGLSVEELEQSLEDELLLEKFRQHLASTEAARHFEAHQERYVRARLSRLVVATESEARELMQQLLEGADFAELARQHSLDTQTRATGGVLGVVYRALLPAKVGDAIFGASAGDVVGPAPATGGFALALVHELLPAELDEATQALIGDELFSRWLAEHLGDGRVELTE